MTFKQIWTALKTTWQSRPLALILPVIALAVFWWTHGHTWTKASFPTFGEWIAGTTLLFAKFGRVMAVFVGEADPATLPPPVVAPLLKPPGVPPVVVLLVFLGLAFGVSGCATVGPIVQACKDCIDEQGPSDLRDLEQQAGPFVEHAFMCDPTFSGVALPPCLVQALAGVVIAMGPDGIRFRDCVIAKVEAAEKAPPLAKKRAHLARARLAAGMPL